MTPLYMQIEDARNTLSCARMEASEELDPVRMRDAGLVLADQVQRLERDVERLQARLKEAAPQRGNVSGGAIILDHDFGGPRHYLDGRPISAGSALFLLTELGWMGGRYESRYPEAVIYLYLPGAHEVSITITPSMRFAWPDQLPNSWR